MKKMLAMVLCLVMVVGLMTGCQKAMDLTTLTQKMDEAMAAATHTAGKTDIEMDIQMGMSGMTVDMGMDLALDMKMAMDMSAGWMDMGMTMDILGESQTTDMEMYLVPDGDDMITYALESTSGTWVKTRQEGYREMTAQTQSSTIKYAEIPQEKLTLAEEKETVGDRECYVLTMNLDGEYFRSMVDSAMGMVTDEATREMLESMDWSKLAVSMTYHVDAETFLPVQCSGEVQGMGDMMGGLVGQLLGGMEGVEMTVTVPVCKFQMTGMAYTGVEIPAVPQEAIDNAVDADALVEEPVVDGGETANQPQADGSYRMGLEGTDSVRIVLPEGYPHAEAAADYLYAMNEEGTVYLTYMLVPGVSGEDMQVSVLSEVDWANQNGYYKSHSEVTELDGYSTMSLIYNDNTSVWYAWRELNGCVLLLGAELEGETFDLAAQMAGVQIVAE